MKTLLLAVLVLMMGCKESVAPEKPCDPMANPKDSLSVPFGATSGQQDSVPVLKIYWCGPIDVK